jgi:MarR family transcriptional regulator, organic hydroperoxide resistance regulator
MEIMATGDSERLFHDVQRVHAQLAAALNLRLRRQFGLPLALLEPMAVIADIGGCRVRDLATELGMSAGTASKLVDRLEAAGYCRRQLNPDDRRSSLLELTAAGHHLCAGARQAMAEELDLLLAGSLSAGQVTELAATLRALRSSAR